MSVLLLELIIETIFNFENYEVRSPKAQTNFEHAVSIILIDLWKAEDSSPRKECTICFSTIIYHASSALKVLGKFKKLAASSKADIRLNGTYVRSGITEGR